MAHQNLKGDAPSRWPSTDNRELATDNFFCSENIDFQSRHGYTGTLAIIKF